jgi:hypothetical protein
MRTAWLVLSTLALSGCAHGFDRGPVEARMQSEPLQVDNLVKAVQSLRSQLNFPCRVAVYLRPADRDWSWSVQDKELLTSWGRELRRDGIASDVMLIPEMLANTGSTGDLRLAAAKLGADALLVLKGVPQTNSYLNPAAVLNLTIVGGFVVPASHRDCRFVMQGSLFDVSNEFLYATVESEGEGKIVRPSFIIEDRPAVEKAKREALVNFGPELLARMRSLASAQVAVGPVSR